MRYTMIHGNERVRGRGERVREKERERGRERERERERVRERERETHRYHTARLLFPDLISPVPLISITTVRRSRSWR